MCAGDARKSVRTLFLFLGLLSWMACGGASNTNSTSTGGTTPTSGSNPAPTSGGSQPGNTGTGTSTGTGSGTTAGSGNSGSGTAGGTSTPTNATAPASTTFLYGTGGNVIGGAHFDSSIGQVTALDMPTDPKEGIPGWLPGTGGLITSLASDPQGRFLYAVSLQTASFGNPIGTNGISAFTIDRATGALTPVAGSPYPMSTRGGTVVVAGGGKFAIVASNTNLTSYSIDETTGALKQVATTGGLSDALVATWDGQYVIAEASNGPVASYKVGSDGTLSEVSRVEVQNRGRLFLSYSGKYLYSSGNDGVTVLSVSPQGQLAITQNNFANWRIVTTTRDDRFAYLATASSQLNAGQLQAFSVDPNSGAIGSAIGNIIQSATGDFPYQITTDFSGKFVIVDMAGSPLRSYTINSDGTLTAGPVVQGPFVGPQFFIQVP